MAILLLLLQSSFLQGNWLKDNLNAPGGAGNAKALKRGKSGIKIRKQPPIAKNVVEIYKSGFNLYQQKRKVLLWVLTC
jgi:hypothetical protein